jgi:putative ABC transport system permease protein
LLPDLYPMIEKIMALMNLTNEKLFVGCVIGTVVVFVAIYMLIYKITSKVYYKIVRR